MTPWLTFLHLLAACSSAGPAAEYLSEDFFPGFHILERVDESDRFNVYARGQATDTPPTVDLTGLGFAVAQQRLESFLKIKPRELLQQPCAIFTSQGEQVRDLSGHSLLFLIEAGQWMWPAVRLGFVQNVSGLPGVQLRTVAVRPVILEVENFMTQQEASEIMALGAKQGLTASQGQMQSNDLKQGTSHASFRTSRQAWLHNDSPVIADLDERSLGTAKLTRIPASHNEPVQLLRYDAGNYYHAHLDWTELDFYPDQRQIWLDSHFGHFDRLATVFWYLNDVQQGGHTIFPKRGQPICAPGSLGGPSARHCRGALDPDMDSCAKGLKVKPRRARTILWYNFLATGRGDRNALHAGCPVGENETKWSVNKWVRNKPDRMGTVQWIPGHPALKRFGWRDPDGQEPRFEYPQDAACHISFQNGFAAPVALLWISEEEKRQLATIPKHGKKAQLSYHGHRFQVKAGDHLSNEVTCQAPSSDFQALQMQEYFEALLRYIPFVDQCEALREFLCSVDVSQMSYDALLDLEQAMGRGGPELRVDAQLIAALPKREVASKCAGCCVICQEPMEKDEDVRVLPCGHEYHFECISQWIHESNTCCVCHSMAVPQPGDCPDVGEMD
eukprot:s1144_g13.t1